MKKFMCRDTRQVFIRIGPDCGRIRVLHATAASSSAKVENERVAFEWSSVHELQFVLADALQVFLDLLFSPVVSVNHHPDLRNYAAQLKFLELAHLDGPVRKRIVVSGVEEKLARAPHRFESTAGSTFCPPVFGWIQNTQLYILGAPRRNVKKDHCGIHEGMLGIQLGCKWTGFVPVRRVRNLDRSCALDTPRLFVDLFEESLLRAGERLHLLYLTAEVAYLVQRIPCGHAHKHFFGHFWNGHRHVEEMPLGMIQ